MPIHPPSDLTPSLSGMCRNFETVRERADNRARGVLGAASCAHIHACTLPVGHEGRHKHSSCGHRFGIDSDSPRACRDAARRIETTRLLEAENVDHTHHNPA